MEMGIAIPERFPVELDMDYNDCDAEEDTFETILGNQYSSLILRIFKSVTDIYGFYAAYIYHMVYDEALDLFEVGSEIESCLMDLAACKIDVDLALAPKFLDFKRETLKTYREWLELVKDKAFRAGVPLKAEILSLVYDGHDSLGHDAEAESLGFNDDRIHPDVYMNELLQGMRIIRQVLPAIIKKLGMDDEFQLVTSDLYVGR